MPEALVFLKRLLRDRRGGTAAMFGILMVPLLLSIGVAVDGARAYMVKTRLSAALDAAGLAVGASEGSAAELQQVMRNFFDANFPDAVLGVAAEPTVAIADKVITLTATAEVSTRFMHLFGYDGITVAASTEVTRETRGLEVVLVLDNTGSMRGAKIAALRQASLDLVDILFGDADEHENLRVGIVPYSAAVNVGAAGPGLVGAMTHPFDPSDDAAWKGCVRARAYPDDVLDSPMSGGNGWVQYWWEGAPDNSWPTADTDPDLCNDGTGPNLGCPTAITPLISHKPTLVGDLNAMQAWCRGGTFSNVGMAWGWRVLSPGAPFSEGLPYGEQGYDKAAILMTDGVNGYYKLPGSPFNSDFSAHGRVDEGLLGTTSRSAATGIINARLAEICEGMKLEGIVLYTITFALSNEDTKSLFRNCASGDARYFDSPSQETLRKNFRKIARELSNLRISR